MPAVTGGPSATSTAPSPPAAPSSNIGPANRNQATFPATSTHSRYQPAASNISHPQQDHNQRDRQGDRQAEQDQPARPGHPVVNIGTCTPAGLIVHALQHAPTPTRTAPAGGYGRRGAGITYGKPAASGEVCTKVAAAETSTAQRRSKDCRFTSQPTRTRLAGTVGSARHTRSNVRTARLASDGDQPGTDANVDISGNARNARPSSQRAASTSSAKLTVPDANASSHSERPVLAARNAACNLSGG